MDLALFLAMRRRPQIVLTLLNVLKQLTVSDELIMLFIHSMSLLLERHIFERCAEPLTQFD